MRFSFLTAFVLLCTSCSGSAPIQDGTGTISGTLRAVPHRAVSQAWKEKGGYGGTAMKDNMVNYDSLMDMYACLIGKGNAAVMTHSIDVSDNGSSHDAVAIAPGDSLEIHNKQNRTLNFYVVNEENAVISYPPLPPGERQSMAVSLTGMLTLGCDEDDSLAIAILSMKGLVAQRVESGGKYRFSDLKPGTYTVVFWYWRFGQYSDTVEVRAGKTTYKDCTLSVDRLVR